MPVGGNRARCEASSVSLALLPLHMLRWSHALARAGPATLALDRKHRRVRDTLVAVSPPGGPCRTRRSRAARKPMDAVGHGNRRGNQLAGRRLDDGDDL